MGSRAHPGISLDLGGRAAPRSQHCPRVPGPEARAAGPGLAVDTCLRLHELLSWTLYVGSQSVWAQGYNDDVVVADDVDIC